MDMVTTRFQTMCMVLTWDSWQYAQGRCVAVQVVTFDPAGVTGHKNHKGCHDSVR